MATLSGLPGTGKKTFAANEFFDNATDALRILDDEGAATTAGSYGAINIWVDDDGRYRGETHEHFSKVARISTEHRESLRSWVAGQLLVINGEGKSR